MKPALEFAKTTIIGGLLFLFPLVAVAIIIAKAFELMRAVATPIEKFIPFQHIGGVALIDVGAVLGIVAICVAGGAFARLHHARWFISFIEAKLLILVPKYTVLKAQLSGVLNADDTFSQLKPVLVRLDDAWQVALAHDGGTSELRTVFLPGSPDPWSGSVLHISAERIFPLDMDIRSVIQMLQRIGRDSGAVLDSIAAVD
jgi:uncharacterized membrane protein